MALPRDMCVCAYIVQSISSEWGRGGYCVRLTGNITVIHIGEICESRQFTDHRSEVTDWNLRWGLFTPQCDKCGF